jgi:hypothetical protein
MDASKKVTDFIKLETGNIGRKSAAVTGAALAASVLGTVLLKPQTAEADPHQDAHSDCHYHWWSNQPPLPPSDHIHAPC